MENKLSLKEIFMSDNWILQKVLYGNRLTRVDASRRFSKADQKNTFSKWGTTKYLQMLCMEHYGKTLEELNTYTLT